MNTANLTLRTAGKTSTSTACLENGTDCAEFIALASIDNPSDTAGSVLYIAAPKAYNRSAGAGGQVNGGTVDHLIINANKAVRQSAGTDPGDLQAKNSNSQYTNYSVVLFCSSCVFSNNILKNGFTGGALVLPSWGAKPDSVQVINNVFKNNGSHTFILNAAGNQINGWADGMIAASLTNSKITGNTFLNNTDVDLILWGCLNCQIQNNKILHTGGLESSSFGAFNIGIGPLLKDQGVMPDTGAFTGTDISGNTIDCGPLKSCGVGLLVGVFENFKGAILSTSVVSGANIHDNSVANAQQGIDLEQVSGINFANNAVTGSGVSSLPESCNDGGATDSTVPFAWSAFNISPLASQIDRTGDKFLNQATTHINVSCLENATVSRRAQIDIASSSSFDLILAALRELQTAYFGIQSQDDFTVNIEIRLVQSGVSIGKIESYFAAVKRAWDIETSNLPPTPPVFPPAALQSGGSKQNWVDLGMLYMIYSGTQSGYEKEILNQKSQGYF